MHTNLILLIEDNANDEILTIRALAQGKIDKVTTVVRDGQEALDYIFYKGAFADRPKSNPEVILLDLELPKVDGAEVLRKIRSNESTKHIPVIILTSSHDEEEMARNYNNGANEYITKPFNIELLNQTMQKFLSYWIGLNNGLD